MTRPRDPNARTDERDEPGLTRVQRARAESAAERTKPSKLLARLRVAGVLGVLGGAATCVLAFQAHARVERWLLDAGDPVMRFAQADHQSAPQRLALNGAVLGSSHGAVALSVRETLDHFEAQCRNSGSSLAQDWARAERTSGQSLRQRPALLDGVFRAEREDYGVVACFAPDVVLSAQSILGRVQRVLQTGELSALGDMRYARVERGQDRSVFLAVWSEGPLDIARMFPSTGDAPGVDVDGVPRPNGSRRLLSVRPEGHGQVLGMFAPAAGVEHATFSAGYRAQLERVGFRVLRSDSKRDDGASFVASDGVHMLTVAFGRDRAGGSVATVVSIPEGHLE